MCLLARLDRASLGSLGDWKAVPGAEGMAELRDHYGPGYRVYFSFVGRNSILLLAGSTKRHQSRAIRQAKEHLEDLAEDETMRASRPFRATQLAQLKDPDNAALYLEEALAAGDTAAFKLALRNVAEARLGGMSALSERTQLNREALYRSLSEGGNPTLETLTKVMCALGLRISVRAERTAARQRDAAS